MTGPGTKWRPRAWNIREQKRWPVNAGAQRGAVRGATIFSKNIIKMLNFFFEARENILQEKTGEGGAYRKGSHLPLVGGERGRPIGSAPRCLGVPVVFISSYACAVVLIWWSSSAAPNWLQSSVGGPARRQGFRHPDSDLITLRGDWNSRPENCVIRGRRCGIYAWFWLDPVGIRRGLCAYSRLEPVKPWNSGMSWRSGGLGTTAYGGCRRRRRSTRVGEVL